MNDGYGFMKGGKIMALHDQAMGIIAEKTVYWEKLHGVKTDVIDKRVSVNGDYIRMRFWSRLKEIEVKVSLVEGRLETTMSE